MNDRSVLYSGNDFTVVLYSCVFFCSSGCHGCDCNCGRSNLRNGHLHRMFMSSTVSDIPNIMFYFEKRGKTKPIFLRAFYTQLIMCTRWWFQLQARRDWEAEDVKRRRYRRISV